MKDRFGKESIDIKNDKLQSKKIVTIKFSEGDSSHEISTYTNQKGYTYYVFKRLKGLSIMNYVPREYAMLSESIKIANDIPIFLDSSVITLVPISYRF